MKISWIKQGSFLSFEEYSNFIYLFLLSFEYNGWKVNCISFEFFRVVLINYMLNYLFGKTNLNNSQFFKEESGRMVTLNRFQNYN